LLNMERIAFTDQVIDLRQRYRRLRINFDQ